jgi:hypothetical protein
MSQIKSMRKSAGGSVEGWMGGGIKDEGKKIEEMNIWEQ